MVNGLIGTMGKSSPTHTRIAELSARVELLELLERAKSDSLQLAAHEIRGPLSVAHGYLSMIQEGSVGPITEDAGRLLAVVQERLEVVDNLVNQMLETARIEDGRLLLRRDRLDLRAVVRSAARLSEPLAETHALTFSCPAHPVPVNGDAGKLGTIITNLIDNAFKYSLDGGNVSCTLAVEGDQATVAVKDHGIGIAPEDVGKLFTRFGRLRRQPDPDTRGVGLGLYLARELARAQGGDITVSSTLHEGSTFTLVLPLAQDGQPSASDLN